MYKNNSLSIPLALAVLALLIGYISRVQHWANGAVIERVAFVTIAILYTARFGLKSKKKLKDIIKLLIVTSWCITSVVAPLKMPYVYLLQLFVVASGLFWLILEIIDLAKRNVSNLNVILFIGALILATEAIFRLQWWPGGSMLHLLALFVITSGFIFDFFKNRRLEST